MFHFKHNIYFDEISARTVLYIPIRVVRYKLLSRNGVYSKKSKIRLEISGILILVHIFTPVKRICTILELSTKWYTRPLTWGAHVRCLLCNGKWWAHASRICKTMTFHNCLNRLDGARARLVDKRHSDADGRWVQHTHHQYESTSRQAYDCTSDASLDIY